MSPVGIEYDERFIWHRNRAAPPPPLRGGLRFGPPPTGGTPPRGVPPAANLRHPFGMSGVLGVVAHLVAGTRIHQSKRAMHRARSPEVVHEAPQEA